MKKLFVSLFILCLASGLKAQAPRNEIKENVKLSASNLLAYPAPNKQLTPAPDGYTPFYISHYGRHGSRFLINPKDYTNPIDILKKADKHGKLTPLGVDVMKRLCFLYDESYKRLGELTPLGAVQHREIAGRMYSRFPEVFKGDVTIDAKSTVVIRCILSMENELQEFVRLNPKLNIIHDASEHDMWYMNFNDKPLFRKRMPEKAKKAYDDFCRQWDRSGNLMKKLFTDMDYVKDSVDSHKLNYHIFHLASAVQNCESRYKITLYDLFSDDDIYANWVRDNASWYINYGPCPLNGGKQPFSQRNLLRKIISEADSCLALAAPGATLRFGHETIVMPLTCLLGLDGYDRQIDNLDKLIGKGWVNYRIFPMGANIQFVFFRNSTKDNDILVKVLLNENEASLPVKTDKAPYYRWRDVREYYLNKLDSYKEN